MEQDYFWLQPESRRLEFKETWPGGSQIAHTAIAFANGAGGRIVFGVKDNPREIIGVPEEEIFELEEKAASHIFDQCSPALINAVIHRDYSVLGSDIKVAIFDDMLEITSPGPLPDNLPPNALSTGRSEIRNRVLAPVFKDLKLIESWGTGIQKMQLEISSYPEIDLVIHEVGNSFQVQFVNKAHDEQVPNKHRTSTEQEKRLLLCFEDNNEYSVKELIVILKLKHRPTFLENYLKPALNSGFIEMTQPDSPKSPTQKYRLTDFGRKILKKDTGNNGTV